MQVGGTPRIPVFSGTAAAMAAKTGMQNGDIFITTDTHTTNIYNGAAWTNVLSGVSQDFVKIETKTLDGSAGTTTFSSISGYEFVKVIGQVRGDGTHSLLMDFNGDTGTNYTFKMIGGTAFSNASGAADYSLGGTAANKANSFDYTIAISPEGSSNNHSVVGLSNTLSSSDLYQASFGYWNGAGDITSITIKTDGGGNLIGQITLYGLRT